MFLSNFSIKRPVAMSALIIVLLLAGLNAYRKLGLDNMPDIEIPFVTITTIYPGASPEEIEVDVAKKIEDAVVNVDGLKHVHTSCMENLCLVTLEFNLDVDVDVAGVDVRERVDLVLNELPDDCEKPKILKFDPNSKPVVTLLLAGTRPVDELFDYADETLSDILSTTTGVAEVQVTGGEEMELHIILDKKKLSASNVTGYDIIKKLEANNVKIPSGTLKEGILEVSVTFDAEFDNLEQIRALEIGGGKAGRIYIRDVAEVKMISKEKRTRAFYNGKPAVNIKIVKKGDANAVKVVNRIRNKVKELNAGHVLPGGMKLVWFTDDGEFIESSVNDAWGSIFLGIILTAIILFMFLHEVRSTIIVCLSMPSSIIVTFIIMRYFDYTMNMITLLALGTSVGVLVTNSIVVIENVFKKLDGGQDSAQAAMNGAGEVALPVFASASTNVVVFIPIALMASLVGRFFVPFAVTMTAATLVSLFMSFTLTPLLSSILLRQKMPEHFLLMRIYIKYWDKMYSALERFYDNSLLFCARKPWVVLCLVFMMLVATFVFIVPNVGTSFFPDNDRGEFVVKIEYPSNSNIDTNISRTLAVAERLRQLPEVKSTSTVCGKIQGTIGKVSEGVYLAEITVKTSSKNQRTINLEEMKKMFRTELENDINCIVAVDVPSVIGGSEAKIQIEISGLDLDTLDKLGKEATVLAQKSGLVVDVDNNIRAGKPELKILPKRTVLEDLSIPAVFLGLFLRGNIEGIEVGKYKVGDRSYDIRVELEEKPGIEQIKEYTLSNLKDHPLSIETVADLVKSRIPIQIARAEKKRIAKIYCNPAPGVAMGNAVTFLQKNINAILPAGYSMRFTGQVEKMHEAQIDFLEAFISASVLTYLLIAALLESWTQPFMILFTLPLALIGMFTILFLTGETLSMMGMLGGVMLIGIVVNNAILIIDQVVVLRAKGMSPRDAMLTAAQEKFRPIIMTSIAAIVGIMPMAFGTGLGSEIRSSCGITVIGGLISSTILSLYVIPMIYIQFIKEKN